MRRAATPWFGGWGTTRVVLMMWLDGFWRHWKAKRTQSKLVK